MPPCWNGEGFVVLREHADPLLVDDYRDEWLRDSPGEAGFPGCTPFTYEPAMRRLLLSPEIVEPVEALIGEAVGLHLALTGWVSTERTFHADAYLNPPDVGEHYCGVWIALDEISPDSGPLQVIPGSHEWPGPTREEVLSRLEPHERESPDWPRIAERFITEEWEAEIERRGAPLFSFIAGKGDVLFWHPHLVHRGSAPVVPGMRRPCLIAHFSGVDHRPDMAGHWEEDGAARYLAV